VGNTANSEVLIPSVSLSSPLACNPMPRNEGFWMTIAFLWCKDGLAAGECESMVEGREGKSAIACSFSNMYNLFCDSIGPLATTCFGSRGIPSNVEIDEDHDFCQYFNEALSEETGEEHRVLVIGQQWEGFLPLCG
jgi:hypothetical protein